MPRLARLLPFAAAGAALLALGGCQLRYKVSLCEGPGGQMMIAMKIDRPGDARIERIAIHAGGNGPAAASRGPDWEAVSPDHRYRALHRIPFGQPIPGFEMRGPPIAFEPGRSYRIEVDGEWHGSLAHGPHDAIGACR